MSRAVAVLKKRGDFLAAARKGRKWAARGLVLQARPWRAGETPAGMDAGRSDKAMLPMRVGYTASRKVGNAVARNRAKRRLREVAAQVLPEHGRPRHDYVLIARAATLDRDFADLIRDLKTALKRVHENGNGDRRGHGDRRRRVTIR